MSWNLVGTVAGFMWTPLSFECSESSEGECFTSSQLIAFASIFTSSSSDATWLFVYMDAIIPKMLSVILSLSRYAILIFNEYLSVDLVLSGLSVAVSFCIWQLFWIKSCSQIFVPFATMPSAPILFFCLWFSSFWYNCFPWATTIVTANITAVIIAIVASVHFLIGSLFRKEYLEFLNLASKSEDFNIFFGFFFSTVPPWIMIFICLGYFAWSRWGQYLCHRRICLKIFWCSC